MSVGGSVVQNIQTHLSVKSASLFSVYQMTYYSVSDNAVCCR